jgi:hypothetical protein
MLSELEGAYSFKAWWPAGARAAMTQALERVSGDGRYRCGCGRDRERGTDRHQEPGGAYGENPKGVALASGVNLVWKCYRDQEDRCPLFEALLSYL